MKKKCITLLVIVFVILFILIIKFWPAQHYENGGIAKCIGENSVLYTQLGCHACERQEEMFGDDAEYLNIVDCFFEQDKCGGVTATPTWFINGEYYKGTRSIEQLKELTGC